jgi:DNA-binding MarR family transcriptional regulator
MARNFYFIGELMVIKTEPTLSAGLKPADHDTNLYMRLLSTIQTSVKETDRLLGKGLGISSAKFAVLVSLLYGGPMTINAIAEKTRTGPNNVTTIIERLRRNGLIVKENGVADRRLVLVNLTDEGQRIVRLALPIARMIVERTMANIGRQDKEAVDRTIATISENLRILRQTKIF